MKVKQAFVIQQKETGRYIGRVYSREHQHDYTPDETKAMRWYDEGEAWEWLMNSIHAPTQYKGYEVLPMKITYEIGVRANE